MEKRASNRAGMERQRAELASPDPEGGRNGLEAILAIGLSHPTHLSLWWGMVARSKLYLTSQWLLWADEQTEHICIQDKTQNLKSVSKEFLSPLHLGHCNSSGNSFISNMNQLRSCMAQVLFVKKEKSCCGMCSCGNKSIDYNIWMLLRGACQHPALTETLLCCTKPQRQPLLQNV